MDEIRASSDEVTARVLDEIDPPRLCSNCRASQADCEHDQEAMGLNGSCCESCALTSMGTHGVPSELVPSRVVDQELLRAEVADLVYNDVTPPAGEGIHSDPQAAAAAVLLLHGQVVNSSWDPPGHCSECWDPITEDWVPYPCATVRAIHGAGRTLP